MVVAGPPCQPFSKAGYWVTGDAARLKDARAGTIDGLFNVVEDLLPQVVLIENVPGLAFKGKDEGLQRILTRFNAINRSCRSNYVPVVGLLDAADYGVPQSRKRVFIVAHRAGHKFEFPLATHGSVERPHVSAWAAFTDLPYQGSDDLSVGGRWADLLPTIPEGQNYLWHTSRGGGLPIFGWRTRYWSFLLKLAKARASWTLSASPGSACGPFHWENRRLSVDEMKRLQSFPDDIQFDCSYREATRLLGNAVPSLLAEVLAASIGNQFFGQRTGAFRLLREPNVVVPPPEPVLPTPARFVPTTGCVPSPHAGEGAGPRALLREFGR